MNKNTTTIGGFILSWNLKGDDAKKLYEILKAEGGWITPTLGGTAMGGRSLDTEFGVSVKWGRTMVTGSFLDALLGGKVKKDVTKEQMPNEMWQDALAFAKSHRLIVPVKPAILAFCFSAMNEGGFEKVAEFQGDNEEPTIVNPNFLETRAQHR